LEVNYRCPPAIVKAARNLLSYNQRRLDKTIRTPEGRTDDVTAGTGPLVGSGPVAVRTAPGDALAGLAVDIITGWRQAGVAIEDIAVLARVNSALLPVQVACLEAGIPCATPLGVGVLNRTGIRTAFAYLRIAGDPDHIRSQDVTDTIRRPSRGIAPMVVDMVNRDRSTSIADIRRLAGRLSGRDVPKLESYADDLEAIVRAGQQSSVAAIRAVRVGVGLDATMDVLDSSRREADRSTHTDELVALESLAALHPDAASFEPWLRSVLSRPAVEGPRVLLSTVHRIKGGEWGHVVVFGVSRGLFPHRLNDDEEGERRVFHVALTRARKQVAVLADVAAPSIFIAELDGSGPRPTPPTGGSDKEVRGGSRRRGKGGSGSPPLPTVEAVEGLVVEHGGHTGTVVEVTSEGVVYRVGTARVDLGFGTDVRHQGRTVTLVAPGDGGAGSNPDVAVAEQALRQWRLVVAKKESVPAYVVLNDKELVGIAERFPTTLSELANCRGMGPIRLERWGDEILALFEGIRSGDR
jgi:hypothetical protein